MKKAKYWKYLLILFLLVFFSVLAIHSLFRVSVYHRLNPDCIRHSTFRSQPLSEEMLEYLKSSGDPGLDVALYWMVTNFGKYSFPGGLTTDAFQLQRLTWEQQEGWEEYLSVCRAVWNDVVYFPIPIASEGKEPGISYVDSWMYERNYGETRGHEGTDIMAVKEQRGFYPVVSMTDGIVTHKGWLEKGGWRIGITAPQGAYFYYAHLDSYAELEVGDSVKAGDFLGYMGDTGYSKIEGTTGNFPVHLHLGIYLNEGENEISVNPYWVLRLTEDSRIKCMYSR